MAVDLEKLVVQMSADIKGYENAMRRAENVTRTEIKKIEDRYKRMGGVLSSSLSAPIAGLGAALSTREVLQYADAWTQAGNLIKSAAQSSGVQVRSLGDLRKGADEARVSLEAYAGLYANLVRSASGVAKSEGEIARATELVSKAMKAGGASTQEQQSAIQQLGQALTSGVLQGDEFRSLRENAPLLAAAIAQEFETTVGGLRKLSEEGKLSADRVFKAILNYGPQIEAQFDATNQTIAEGFTKISNALTEYVGTMAQSVGLTRTINTILGALAGNIDVVADAAAAAAVVLLSRYVPAMTRVVASQALVAATNPFLLLAVGAAAATIAIAEFGDEIHPIADDMANLQDYSATVWDGIISGASEAASQTSDAFLKVINGISDAIGGVEVAWGDVGSFVKDVINGMIGGVVALYEVVKTNFSVLPSVIGAAGVGAMNAMIAAVEAGINKMVKKINQISTAVNAASSAVGMGSFAPVLDNANFGRLENEYVAKAKEVGTAAAKAIDDAMNTDYLGSLSKNANVHALDRRQQQRDARDSQSPISGAGYGIARNAPAAAAGGGAGGKAKKAKENELDKEIEQITRRTAALKAETAAQASINPLIDDYGYAVAKAKGLQDLETKAREAGINVTGEQRAAMEQLAEGYAQAVVASATLAESQDKLQERAEDFRNLSKNTAHNFVQDLVDGKSAADALADALARVGERLIDMAFDSMFDPRGGIFGTIGNSLATAFSAPTATPISGFQPALYHNGGVVGFGGASSGKAYSPALWANAPRYHNGGIAGLKPNEIPTILQRGERVTPNGGFGGGGNRNVVLVELSNDLEGRLLTQAADHSVQIVRKAQPSTVKQSVKAVGALRKQTKNYLA